MGVSQMRNIVYGGP